MQSRLVDEPKRRLCCSRHNILLTKNVNGQTYQVEVPQTVAQVPQSAATHSAPQTGGPKNVVSELPGTVTTVNVSAGQRVKRGETLLVIEAMKMANDIVSEVD